MKRKGFSTSGKTRESAGMAVFVVLFVLLVLFVYFFFLSVSSSRFRHITVGILEENVALRVANAARALFCEFLENSFRKRAGCPALYPATGCDSPLNPLSGRELDGFLLNIDDFDDREAIHEYLENLARECSSNCPPVQNIDVQARFRVNPDRKSVDGMSVRLDGIIDFLVRVKFKGTRGTSPTQFGQKDTYEFTFSREFKLFQLLPVPCSKFSLYVKKVPNQEFFNIQKKGFQDDEVLQKILVLHNSSKPFSATDVDAWQKNGWVYLGGDRIVLNVDGSHPSRSQSDFFLQAPTIAFNPDSILLFNCVSAFPGQVLKYGFIWLGCMSDWVNLIQWRWMLDYPFDLNVPGEAARTAEHVSVLRPFGDKRQITPTMVVGKVHFRSVLYGALIYDANDDNLPDIIYPVASHPAVTFKNGTVGVFPLMRIPSASLYFPERPYPALLNLDLVELFDLGNMGVSNIPASLGALLSVYDSPKDGKKETYQNFMSKLTYEDYPEWLTSANSQYDYLLAAAAGGGYDPLTERPKQNFSITDYPNDGKNFNLKGTWTPVSNLFSGDLSQYDPGGFYRDPSFFSSVFANQDEFLKEGPISRQNGSWIIERTMAVRISGPLRLTDPLRVNAPCIMAVNGDIELASLEAGKPLTSPHGFLILVSLGGKIFLNGGEINKSYLLAPDGTIIWKSPLSLSGGMAVNQLDPIEIAKSGGRIDYDPDFDPANATSFLRGFTVVLGPDIPVKRKK